MSTDPRGPEVFGDEDVVFRTLAAPGLDEDDLFAALGVRDRGVVWGQDHPCAFPPDPQGADDEVERRRRHERLLEKWTVVRPQT